MHERDEFDAWLVSDLEWMTPEEQQMAELKQALGVGGG